MTRRAVNAAAWAVVCFAAGVYVGGDPHALGGSLWVVAFVVAVATKAPRIPPAPPVEAGPARPLTQREIDRR